MLAKIHLTETRQRYITETMEKVREFYTSPEFRYAPLVDGAIEGVQALRQLGYRLVIVTARSRNMTELTENWVRVHFAGVSNFTVFCAKAEDNTSAQGCFEAVHYTGAFEKREMEVTPSGVRRVKRKLEKIEASHIGDVEFAS